MVSVRFLAAVALPCLCAAITPAAVYDGGYYGNNSPILLGIGNGGAGQSGLIKGTPYFRHPAKQCLSRVTDRVPIIVE